LYSVFFLACFFISDSSSGTLSNGKISTNIPVFILENSENLIYTTSTISELKRKAEKAKIEKTYVKTSTKYACYYKEDDLKNLIVKKKSVKNKRRPRKIKAERNKPISFNFFGLKISISK
jgi:hypothetical protein